MPDFRRIFLILALSLCAPLLSIPAACASTRDGGIDLDRLEDQLKSQGVEGWVHGAVPGQGLFVFTVRDPNDFFTNYQFPLVTEDAAVQSALAHLRRHDKVRVKGQFAAIPAPLKHIMVASVDVVKPSDDDLPAYDHQVVIPDDLAGKTSLVGRVHAVAAGGKVMVVEYEDVVLPVFVRDPSLTKDLYRGDKIRLHFRVRAEPNHPTHLAPDPAVSPNVEVLESIRAHHGEKAKLTGTLVLFKKSPQITRDVYALQIKDPEGAAIQYTLVNFEDPAVLEAIGAKAKAAWDAHAATAVNGRNRWVNPQLSVTAEGTVNVTSPEQANPQLLLPSADALRIDVVP